MNPAKRLLGAAALATIAGAPAVVAAPDPLARYRWSARVVVVAAPSADDAFLARQRQILAEARDGAVERDLALVEAVGDGPDAAALRRRFGLAPGRFAAILVGKDGGAKLSSDRPIEAAALFDEIDAMPMRQGEMRGRAKP